MRLPKEASTFTPIDDDTYNKAGDVLEVITLWDSSEGIGQH